MSWWRTKFPGGHDLAGDPQVDPFSEDTDETSARKPASLSGGETATFRGVTAKWPKPEGGDATCSEPKRLKSGTSDTPLAFNPEGGVDEIRDWLNRDRAIEEQLREQPIFTTGEVLLIRGGFFKVHAVTEKRLYLSFQGEAGQLLKQQER